MKGSLTMIGMVVGSTLGGAAPMLYGGGIGASLLLSLVGGILGIWAGLRINERML
jgi:outer membrane lipoprotein SlyB